VEDGEGKRSVAWISKFLSVFFFKSNTSGRRRPPAEFQFQPKKLSYGCGVGLVKKCDHRDLIHDAYNSSG
jgi:hypothetical protein